MSTDPVLQKLRVCSQTVLFLLQIGAAGVGFLVYCFIRSASETHLPRIGAHTGIEFSIAEIIGFDCESRTYHL